VNDCTWVGLMGYIFAFLFFLLGTLLMLLQLCIEHFCTKQKRWILFYEKESTKDPLNFFIYLFSLVIIAYFIFYKLGFVIIPKYWHCLMLSS